MVGRYPPARRHVWSRALPTGASGTVPPRTRCGSMWPSRASPFLPSSARLGRQHAEACCDLEGSSLLKTADKSLDFATMPVDLGRNGGRRHNCTSRLLSCTSSPPTAGTFAQQDKCITSQLERANVTHEDRACDNHFMSDDGRMTLGDFDLATVDGSPALNAFGHRMHFLYSTTPYYTAV